MVTKCITLLLCWNGIVANVTAQGLEVAFLCAMLEVNCSFRSLGLHLHCSSHLSRSNDVHMCCTSLLRIFDN